MREPYDRGFESQCSKVEATPAANIVWFGIRFQTLIRQERVFVCLEQAKITSYATIMEAFQMRKYRDSIFIRLFPQWLDSLWQPARSLPNIENTYPQLP